MSPPNPVLLSARLWSLLLLLAASACDGPRAAREDAPARADSASSQPTPNGGPLRLAILTDLHGVLEPCGCTPASAGGADRIAALVSELKRTDPQLLYLVAGDAFFSASGRQGRTPQMQLQERLKADAWAELLRHMKVDAIAPGHHDLTLGAEVLVGLARQSGVSIIASAPPIEGLDRMAAQVVRSAGSRRIALLATGEGANADLNIVFRHGEQRLHEPAVGADVVIHSGLQPARSLAAVEDGVLHVSAGDDGEELLVLELWPGAERGAWQLTSDAAIMGPQRRARLERHRLTAAQPSDPEVRRLLEQLFARINEQNRTLAASGGPSGPIRQKGNEPPAFMGARTCAACHTQAYFAWRESAHARAYQTLEARGRELDLDCIGCHVTGFGQPRGSALGHLEELLGVGCESCHGAGEEHANNPNIRQRTVHRAVPENECRGCHDPAHSDAFDYVVKRQRLLVPGHGLAGPGSDFRPRR